MPLGQRYVRRKHNRKVTDIAGKRVVRALCGFTAAAAWTDMATVQQRQQDHNKQQQGIVGAVGRMIPPAAGSSRKGRWGLRRVSPRESVCSKAVRVRGQRHGTRGR